MLPGSLAVNRTKLDRLIATVDQRFEAVDQRFETVDRRFDGVERRLDRIEVAVEDIRDQVKLIAEGHAATQALVNRKFEEVVARFDRRVEPLELVVRHDSRVIEHHNLTEGSDPL